MNSTLPRARVIACDETLQLVTFRLGEMTVGLDIRDVQEINKNVRTTYVPHAPPIVRGVINLRGEILTVLDTRVVLDLDQKPVTDKSRTVVVTDGEQRTGLLVDEVADIVHVERASIAPPPAHLSKVDHRFVQGILQRENDLLVILRTQDVLAIEAEAASRGSTKP